MVKEESNHVFTLLCSCSYRKQWEIFDQQKNVVSEPKWWTFLQRQKDYMSEQTTGI